MIKFWKILENKGEKSKETFEDAAKVSMKNQYLKKSALKNNEGIWQIFLYTIL